MYTLHQFTIKAMSAALLLTNCLSQATAQSKSAALPEGVTKVATVEGIT